jgi:hypothetical protein
MAGLLWVTDREPGIRELFAELLPDAEVLDPDELAARIALGQRPDAMVVDGTQLLDLPPRQRASLLSTDRLLICTGLSLTGLSPSLVAHPGVAILGKPFCIEDLEVAAEWLRGEPATIPPTFATPLPAGVVAQAPRPRGPRGAS